MLTRTHTCTHAQGVHFPDVELVKFVELLLPVTTCEYHHKLVFHTKKAMFHTQSKCLKRFYNEINVWIAYKHLKKTDPIFTHHK